VKQPEQGPQAGEVAASPDVEAMAKVENSCSVEVRPQRGQGTFAAWLERKINFSNFSRQSRQRYS